MTTVDMISRDPSPKLANPMFKNLNATGYFKAAVMTTISPGFAQVYLVPKSLDQVPVCSSNAVADLLAANEVLVATSIFRSEHPNTLPLFGAAAPQMLSFKLCMSASDDLWLLFAAWKLPV